MSQKRIKLGNDNYKKEINLKILFPVYILIAFLFIVIGYAQISSIETEITGTVLATAQSGIFITDVNYVSDESALIDNSSNSFSSTLLHSNIALSNSIETSSITYEITFYNNTNDTYVFMGTTIDDAGDFYSNYDITYEISGVDEYERIAAYSTMTLNITFYYKDSVLASSNTLDAYISFDFEYYIYCAENGYTSLSECLVSNETEEDYQSAVITIANKTNPSYKSIAPSYVYGEVVSNGTISTLNSEVVVGTSYDFDSSTGEYTLNDTTLLNIRAGELTLDDNITYYTSNTSSNTTDAIYEIQSISSSYKTMIVITYKSSISEDNDSSGMFATTDYNGGTTYYYRGNVDNNWVSFGGYLWRIVRINEDGSVRMVYSGTTDSSHTGEDAQIGTSAFNNRYQDITYVGYTYGENFILIDEEEADTVLYKGITANATYYFGSSYTCHSYSKTCSLTGDIITGTWDDVYDEVISSYQYTCFSSLENGACTKIKKVISYDSSTSAYIKWIAYTSETLDDIYGTTSSTIKGVIDSWYEENIMDVYDDSGINLLSSYLADEIFCGDRVLYSAWNNYPLSDDTTLMGYRRINSYTLYSPSLVCDSNDTYTVSNSILSYPVALLSADEVWLVGGLASSGNSNYYLYTGSTYWTMTPSRFISSYGYALVWFVESSGRLYSAYYVAAKYGVRPVINLSSNVLYVSGSGTEDDPYIVGL